MARGPPHMTSSFPEAARAVAPRWIPLHTTRAGAGLAFLAAMAALAAGPAAHAQGGALAGASTDRFFSLPETREASELVVKARGHLSTPERRPRAFTDLNRLLERHRGDVLPPEGTRRETHVGAAEWARRALFDLSPAGLKQYAETFSAAADAALEIALSDADSGALLDLVRRWPVAPAAHRAWLALGDLEFERGHGDEARLAWERARDLGAILGDVDAGAVERRLERLASLADSAAAFVPDASWRLPGPGEGGGPLPGADHERFVVPLPESPFNSERDDDGFNLFPVVWGEQVFATTSLRVLAVHAFDGALQWTSPEPEGWGALSRSVRSDYFAGVDRATSALAPAVGSGVVVAALQVPRFALDNDDFQGIVITVRLPERRLFAFDTASGRPLWNHAPMAGVEIDARPFQERMHVAGAPVVAGSRVLVPLARMQGRVELHLGCFELGSGRLLWSTNVISGQRELNMFNRHEREFVAPPVRVEGDRVLMLTQLGTLAAFDLFAGHVLWQTAYEQIPLPTTRGWSPPERRRVWKTAPPVVSDGVVLATPIDSEDLVAVDLESGALLWSMPRDRLRPRRASDYDVDTLLGARSDRVLLGGGWITAYTKAGGLRSRQPGTFEPPEFELGRGIEESTDRRPRALALRAGIAIPGRSELLVLPEGGDRPDTARSLALGPLERGNLVAGEGALYSASGRWLHGFLDVAQLEERARARLAAAPGDIQALISLARLGLRRGNGLANAGDPGAAAAGLGEIRRAVEARLGAGARKEVLTHYGELVRHEAQWLADAGESAGARSLLVGALERPFAPREALDLMLELHPILLALDRPAWEVLLADIDRVGAGLDVPIATLARLDPLWMRFARSGAPGTLAPVPVPLWTAVQRALDAERGGDFAAALEHWHLALLRGRHGTLAEGVPTAERVTELIGALLDIAGRAWYEPFDGDAQRAYDDANRRRDRRALEEVVARYPFARAADDARQALVEFAFELGDTRALVEAVLASGRPSATPDGKEVSRLILLALGLGQAGNPAFERGLLAELARSHPDHEIRHPPHTGRALREWRATAASTPPSPAFDRAVLDPALAPVARLSGARTLIGALPREPSQGDALGGAPWIVVADNTTVEAYPADGSPTTLWTAKVPRPVMIDRPGGAVALFANRVVLLQSDGLVGLDAADGRAAWRWDPEEAQVLDIASSSGVLLGRIWQPGVGFTAIGIEPVTGIELWRAPLANDRKWLAPILGERFAVYASDGFGVDTRLVVLDVFRGAALGTYDLDENLGARLAAWIQDGKLYLPSFLTQRLIAFDLASGTVPWTLKLAPGLDLFAVLEAQGAVFLVAQPRNTSNGGPTGEVLAVDLARGGARTVHPLGRDDRLMGVLHARLNRLDAPFLFVATCTPGSVGTPVAAVHLGSGRRWIQRLPVQPEELYEGAWPAPAVSRDLAIVPYVTRDPGTRNRRAVHLVLLDLSSGARRDARVLPSAYARVEDVGLLVLGDSLWVNGRSPSGRESRLEIWRANEKTR